MREKRLQVRTHYIHRLHYSSLEKIVGAFVLLSISMLVWLLFSSGKSLINFEDHYILHGKLENIQSIDQNTEIFSSSNEGWEFTNWTENDTVVSFDSTHSINVKENRTLVANYTILTNVEDENNTPELNFVSQPYPNPFNPSTVFHFGIAKTSSVSLSIFDVSGKLVATLIDSELYQAGIYNKTFSVSEIGQISSGVYFFRFYSSESNSNKITLETGKLILLK